MDIISYEQVFSKLQGDVIFLLVTATDVETNSVLESLNPLDEFIDIKKCFVENGTYYIGKLGIYNVINVQCGGMGAVGRDSSVNTVSNAIKHWGPNAIIMVGIAFGIDSLKQQIGDVLVSQSIVNYEVARISKDGIIYRGSKPESGKLLLNRFQNMLNWNFSLGKEQKARKHVGLIVSGEKLVDNIEFKDILKQNFPNSIGGEMEGFGLYSASANANINEWIIIKGICDWADGNKSENKSENQKIAAESSVSLCKAVLSEKAFDDLGRKKKQQDGLNSVALYTNFLPAESRYAININNAVYNYFRPQHINNGTCRRKLIESICKSIKNFNWINLWGNIWSGKSQLLLLLSDQLSKYYWIQMKNRNSDEALQMLLQLMVSSVGYEISDLNNLVSAFLNNLDENTLIIIDDMPFIPRDHKLVNLVIYLCYQAEQRQIRLITAGNQNLTSIVGNDVVMNSINVPAMNAEEVKEILQNFGAPDRILKTKINELLAASNGRTPAIIMALIKYLENNDWNINDKAFDAIIFSNAGEVSFELQRLINHTIPNQETRELLYRIAIIGHEIPQSCITEIACTPPPIYHPMERLDELLTQWIVINDDGQYSVPASIKNIAGNNVSNTLKKQVSLVVAGQIIKKHTLNEFDITQLIGHYLEAEQYDDAGNIYIRALWELDNSEYTSDPFMFTAFWSTLPLPEQMSDDIKCRIRLLQIKVFKNFNKDFSYAINDLIKCSEKHESLYHYLFIGAVTIGLSDTDAAMELFYRALLNGTSPDFQGSDLLPMNIINGILFITTGSIKDIEQLKKWFRNLKLISLETIEEACEQSILYASIFIALERVTFKALKPNCKKELIMETKEIFSEIQLYGQKNNWPFLYAMAVREQLRLFNLHDSYENVTDFHKSITDINDNQLSCFLITSMMAMISYDRKDYESAKILISKAQTYVFYEDFLLLDKVNLHLNMSSILSLDEDSEKSVEETEKALNIVISAVDWGLAYKLKIFGEHIINIYLHGFTKRYISLYYKVANLLLENNTFEGREEVLAVWCHILTYIANDIIYNNKPTKFGDEEYAPPRQRMFINDKDSEWFLKNHSEDKMFFALFYISDLLNFYGKTSEAQEILKNAVISKKITPETNVQSNLGLVAFVTPYIWLQAIKCGMIADAFYFIKLGYKHFYKDLPSHVVINDYFAMHFFMITVSLVNRYIEIGRDSGELIIKSFVSEINSLCESYIDIPFVNEYNNMIKIFINEHPTSDVLIHTGNNIKQSIPDLQAIAYILSTAELPITQNTLLIQINVLQYISFRIKPNDAFYRLEYYEYLKNTWLDLLSIGKGLNENLINAKKLLIDAVVAPKLEDIKQVLRLLIDGYDVKLNEDMTKWLFD